MGTTNIYFQSSPWLIGLCIALGLVYAITLYFRDKTFREQSRYLNWILGTLRFLAVTFLSILLLSPLLKSRTTDIKKPIVILAQDQSESIAADWTDEDSAKYVNQIADLKTALSDKYELKEYAFGSKVKEGIDFQFKDKESNLSDVLHELFDLYSNQHLGAVIMASDGIFNKGSSPIYAGAKLGAPIYTIALGDTTPQKDVVLKRVFHNKIAYLGDKFSIQADILAQNCSASSTTLQIYKIKKGQSPRKLQSIPVNINKNDFFATQEVILDAEASGVQRYRLVLTSVKDEITTLNNSKDIFVDVLDARQRILIVANSPHPDLSALKQTILLNKNYEAKISHIKTFKENVKDYDFVILHQLPSKKNAATKLIKQLNDYRKPRLYIVGSQTNTSALSQQQSILKISGGGTSTNEVQAIMGNNFNLFTINDRIPQVLPKFPPILAPFGEYASSPDAQVLLYQKIGTVGTRYPLLVFGDENGVKTGVLAAEGIWKWRMFDYLQHTNQDIFNEVFSKSIQFLTVKEDKRKFRVSVSKNIYNENESIIFDAELYNQTYELINDPDVSLTITNSSGKDFGYTFNKTSKSYTLNAGKFPVGNYTFQGKVNINGEQLKYNGQFSVQPIQLEVFEMTANHGLMRILGERYGGKMVYPDQMDSLVAYIAKQETAKPRMYERYQTRSVINLKWIFFVLLSLLSLEWFLRRYFGAY